MIIDSINNVGIWMEQFRNGYEFYQNNNFNNKNSRLRILIIDKLENLTFPPEIDVYETQLKLRMSVSIYDKMKESFISNTYKSPFLTIFLTDLVNMIDNSDDERNDEGIKLKKQTRSQPKAKSGQAITRYQHAAVWVGFIMNKGQYLKDYKIAIEFTLSQYNNKTKQTQTFKTLGYALIDLETKLTFADIYSGSVRELTNAFYNREQKQLKPLSISFKWKNFSNVPSNLMKLIGPYKLFGYNDNVIGLRIKQLPSLISELKYLEFDEAINLYFLKCKLYIHQIVDLEIINYIIKKQKELSAEINDQQQIVVKKIRSRLIAICHNGWRDVNETGFENSYILNEIDRTNTFIVYSTEKPIRADRIYKESVVIFQLIYYYDIEIQGIKQDPIEVNVGYFILSPKDCNKASEQIKLLIHGEQQAYNSKKYFASLSPRYPGEAIIQYEQTYFETMKQEKKNKILPQQVQQKMYEPNSLKGRLIELSIKKKNEIKSGLAREENIMRQEKLLNDLHNLCDNTSTTIISMIQANSNVQANTQILLHDFQGLLEMGTRNFQLAKDKYQLEELKLLTFRRRKDKLDALSQKAIDYLKHKFDKWQYEQIHHPNLEVFYTQNLQDFYNKVNYGNRNLPFNRVIPFDKEIPNSNNNIKINLQLTAFKFILKIHLDQKDQNQIPSIYLFDNYCPIQIFFKIHILGEEDDIQCCEARSFIEFKKWINDRMKMHLLFTKIIPNQELNNNYAIIEIWNGISITPLGRCSIPLFHQENIQEEEPNIIYQSFQECDVLSYDENQIIGQLDIGILIQYTDDIIQQDSIDQTKQKEVIIVEKIGTQIQQTNQNIQININKYDDIIRIYYSSQLPQKIQIINPALKKQNLVQYLRYMQILNNPSVYLDYVDDQNISLLCKVPYRMASETFLLLYNSKKEDQRKLIQVYKLIIYNCISLNFTEYVGKMSTIEIPYQTNLTNNITIKPANPYLVRPQEDSIPIIINTIYKIPIQCLAIDQTHFTTKLTLEQGDNIETLLINFKPKEYKVNQIYNFNCKSNNQEEQIEYQNKSETAVLLQIVSQSPALLLTTQHLKLEINESQSIRFTLNYFPYSKQLKTKIYLTNLEENYLDCLMFIIDYIY